MLKMQSRHSVSSVGFEVSSEPEPDIYAVEPDPTKVGSGNFWNKFIPVGLAYKARKSSNFAL